LPWFPLGRKLWKAIRDVGSDSVSAWKAFALAYPTEILMEGRTHKPPPIPQDMLPAILPHLSAPNLEFTLMLILQKPSMSRYDWMSLAELPNLGALAIYEEGPHFEVDFRVVRGWADHIKGAGGFPELRLLLIKGQNRFKNRFTDPKCLEYFASFPKLQSLYVDLAGEAYVAQYKGLTNWSVGYMEHSCEYDPENCLKTPSYKALEVRLARGDQGWRHHTNDTPSYFDGASLTEKPVLSVFVGEERGGRGSVCSNLECRYWYERVVYEAPKSEGKHGQKRKYGEFVADNESGGWVRYYAARNGNN
jgi:hypothetical protein